MPYVSDIGWGHIFSLGVIEANFQINLNWIYKSNVHVK